MSTADHEFCDIHPFTQQHVIYEFSPRKLIQTPFGRLNQFQRWCDLLELDQIHQEIAKTIDLGNYDVLFANTSKFTFIPILLQYVDTPSAYYLHEPFGPNFARSFFPIPLPADERPLKKIASNYFDFCTLKTDTPGSPNWAVQATNNQTGATPNFPALFYEKSGAATACLAAWSD